MMNIAVVFYENKTFLIFFLSALMFINSIKVDLRSFRNIYNMIISTLQSAFCKHIWTFVGN